MPTVYFYPTQTKSWRNGAWRTDSTNVYQGMYPSGGSNYAHTGVIWFDVDNIRNVLAGKTVQSTYLRMFRPNNHGNYVPVHTGLGRNNHALSMATQPWTRDGHIDIGTWERGENKWVWLPEYFMDGIRYNYDNCLIVYTTDKSDNGYAIFSGASATYAEMPCLQVTFTEGTAQLVPPSACSLDATVSESNATLSWSGAADVPGNALFFYEVESCDSSNNSSWGAWGNRQEVRTGETSASVSVSPPATRGYYRKFRVRACGTAGASFDSPWKESSNSLRKNILATPPTSFSAAPVNYVDENITLSWSGAVAGTAAIKQYSIELCTSTNGTTWSGWAGAVNISSSGTSGSTTVVPPRTLGTYTKYRVRVTDTLGGLSSYKESNPILAAYTACTAPTALAVSATLSETTVTLSWSGAAGGAGNAIASYELQYCDSGDNVNFGSWVGYSSMQTTAPDGSQNVLPPNTRGYYRKFRIRTRGAAGADYYSGWRESSNTLRKNIAPMPPKSLTAKPAVYLDEAVTLEWSGAAAGTSAISQQIIQNSTSKDGVAWSTWNTLATIAGSALNGTYVDNPSGVIGTQTKYRISYVDVLGAVSAYTVSEPVIKSGPPPAPQVFAPAPNSVTYNKSPRMLLRTSAWPSTKGVSVHIRQGGVWYDSVAHSAQFSSGGILGENTPTVFHMRDMGVGTQTVLLRAKDQSTATDGLEESRSFTVAQLPFEAVLTGETLVKAEHMTEIRLAVNRVRHYYGLAAVSWQDEIARGKTPIRDWPRHIDEIRAALESVVELLNSFDPKAGGELPVVDWVMIRGGRPSAAAINQIRDLILSL